MFSLRSRQLAARIHSLFGGPSSEAPADYKLLQLVRSHADDSVMSIYAADVRALITLMHSRVASQTTLRIGAEAEAARNLQRAQKAEEIPGDLCIRFDWETGRLSATDPARRLGLDGISDVLAIVGRVLRGIKADHDRRNSKPASCCCPNHEERAA